MRSSDAAPLIWSCKNTRSLPKSPAIAVISFRIAALLPIEAHNELFAPFNALLAGTSSFVRLLTNFPCVSSRLPNCLIIAWLAANISPAPLLPYALAASNRPSKKPVTTLSPEPRIPSTPDIPPLKRSIEPPMKSNAFPMPLIAAVNTPAAPTPSPRRPFSLFVESLTELVASPCLPKAAANPSDPPLFSCMASVACWVADVMLLVLSVTLSCASFTC